MIDCFALLSEPRRPWLDPVALKARFLALSARVHPDKAAPADRNAVGATFADLNAAYHCLTEPKSRLLHLLELERGHKPADLQEIPAALAYSFAEIAAACRSADAFLSERSRATSPLLQVQWFGRGQEWVETLNALQRKLTVFHHRLLETLKTLDLAWMQNAGSRDGLLAQLEDLYRLFGYSNRWHSQIRERLVQLSL